MTPFRLAYLDLARKRAPTFITILSIAASIACAGTLVKLYLLSESRFSTIVRGPDAIIGAKAGGLEILLGALNLEGPPPGFIPDRLYQTLRHEQKIAFGDGSIFDRSALRLVVPILIFGQYRGYRVIGTDSQFFDQPTGSDMPQLLSGRWFGPGAEVVLGEGVARKEGVRVGDSIAVSVLSSDRGRNGEPSVVWLSVVGIARAGGSAWNRACFSSIAGAREAFARTHAADSSTWKNEVLHYLLVYLRPGAFPAVAELINNRSVAEAVSVPVARQRLEELTGTGMRLGLMLTLIVLLLACLSVAAVMITRFEGMKIQVAVLRALGFSLGEICRWLLWEGTMLGFVACIVGALVDMALFPSICNALGNALPPREPGLSQILSSASVWGASIVATVIAVIVPLIQISRQDIHSSLKGQ